MPDGHLNNTSKIDTASVILNGYRQALAFGAHAKCDQSGGWFSLRNTLPRRLDSVADRVSQQMHERVLQHIEHAAVGIDAGVGDAKIDLLRFIARQIPHHLAKAFDQTVGGHHTRLPDIRFEAVCPGRSLSRNCVGAVGAPHSSVLQVRESAIPWSRERRGREYVHVPGATTPKRTGERIRLLSPSPRAGGRSRSIAPSHGFDVGSQPAALRPTEVIHRSSAW